MGIKEAFSILDSGPIMIRYTGVFDFEGLYRMMHAWLINKRFIFHENRYRDKVFTPFGNELEIEWVAEKKVTEYVMEYIEVKFHLWDFSEVEVIKEGKKMKMTKSRLEIRLDAKLELDYTKKFADAGPIAKKLGAFYQNKVIYWEWRIKYADSLTYNLYDLHHKIKKYLGLYSDSNAY
ncbi:MAG: hypothetical protein KatS3mg002_0746 [Candidatus Woesearchaeota archaeon]|nr:MAG: hypothetical protein KatS3mg002_0746 [Candidatus Woesearchaeota archaeon]